MRLCQRYRIHLISDEIYALSTWENPDFPNAVKFTSVSSIDLMGIIDPELVHVLWGMSKARRLSNNSPFWNDYSTISRADASVTGLRRQWS
jgi:aspartate/methionine/tyrosine aminotransferase